MTCIIGLVHEGQVWIGGDGRATVSDNIVPLRSPKVFRKGKLLVGCSGSLRILQIFQHEFEVPKLGGMDMAEWLCRKVSPAFFELLAARGALLDASAESMKNTNTHFLIAGEGRLFKMDNEGGVYESCRDFECIGSGIDVASGYMMASRGVEPELRILCALRASEEFLNTCGPPYTVEKL